MNRCHLPSTAEDRFKIHCSWLVALFLVMIASATAKADDPLPTPNYSGNLWDRSTLTGDWGGLRNQLAEKGVTLDASVTQVFQGVVSGGLDTAWQYGGRENITLKVDTQKLFGWQGGFLFVEGEGNFGEFVGARQDGAILPVDMNQALPLPNAPNFYLPALQYVQFLSHQFGLFIGKNDTIVNGDMNAFAHGKGNEGFLNTAFCFNPTFVLSTPYSALGAGAIILPTSDPDKFIITIAILDTEGSPATEGFNTMFKGGTTYSGEARYTTDFFNMTGHQDISYAYSDKLYTSLNQNLRNLIIPALPVEKRSGTWALGYNFDQYIFQPDKKADRGFGVFGRFGISDGVANPVYAFYSGGLGGKGIIPGRKNDSFGLGYFYGETANAKIPARLGFKDSQGFEAYYEIAITPWAHLTPDIQVIRPSQQHIDTSVILGMRLEMKF